MPDIAQVSASPATPAYNDSFHSTHAVHILFRISVFSLYFALHLSMSWYHKGRVIGVCIGRPDDVGWEINALHSRRTEGNA
jgi:hypothetical protein